jgi:hypothetical protein
LPEKVGAFGFISGLLPAMDAVCHWPGRLLLLPGDQAGRYFLHHSLVHIGLGLALYTNAILRSAHYHFFNHCFNL